MREILFRGKRFDNGEWVEGYLIHDEHCNTHIPYIGYLFGHDIDVAECILGTVGQFTGLTDKNGKKIFEGDVLKWDAEEWGAEYCEPVVWDYSFFGVRQNDWQHFCEVIGNIHDNPELLRRDGNA